MTLSPWQAVLGEQLADLRPELQAYFAPIPPGMEGVGRGVFDVVGTPYLWMRPILRLVGGRSLFAIRAENVPFVIRNTAVPGRAAVRAARRIHLRDGTRTMHDETGATADGRLVDRIGVPPRMIVDFRAAVVDGALRLDSTGVRLRFGPVRVALGPLSPQVVLTERFDPGVARQRVALSVDAPIIGRIYGYAGSFAYAVQEVG